MQSSYNTLTTGMAATNEYAMYSQLPELVIAELPHEALMLKHALESTMCLGYGFLLEDLVDDCLLRTSNRETAEDSLEEWFDDVSFGMMEAYGEVIPRIDYLNVIGQIFQSLRETMNLLYTPSGHHYYEFKDWPTNSKTGSIPVDRPPWCWQNVDS